MLRNYFKIAWRNLLKNKTFSIINIFGLAVGLCCFLLISLYVIDELSYDRHFKNANRIYRINSDINFGGSEMKMSQSSDPMGAILKKDYPQVEQFTRLYTNYGSNFIKKGTEFINEQRIAHADSTFFDMFSIPVFDGNPKTALDAPNTIAISKSTAQKYFQTSKAVGKSLEVGVTQKTIYNVTAVFEDMPSNSHFDFDFICSMDNVNYDWGNFTSHNFSTYVRLAEGVDYRTFNKKFDEVIERYILPKLSQLLNIKNLDEFKKTGNSLKYTLFPMTDIHLKSDRDFEIGVGGDIQYVYIFGAVALFLLLIACINFMNLSTARSSSRAKEVGIRKVLGTERQSLIGQFLSESILTSFISMILALLMIAFLLPIFNEISAKTFSISNLFGFKFFPFLVILPLIVGLIAGYYPAFFLSSYQPIKALKSNLNVGFSKSNLRSVLVTFQFAVSLTLIIFTIIIYQQLHYIQTKNVGFNKDQVLVLIGTGALKENQEAFKNEIAQLAGVKSATGAQFLPVSNSSRNNNTFSKEAVMNEQSGFNMQVWRIDYNYITTLGMEMAHGRNFSKEFGSDSSGLIINETTAKMLGYKDPIGKKLYTSDGDGTDMNVTYTIVGVVKNFHFSSLRENIGPLCMKLGVNRNGLAFKVNTSDMPNLLSQIESKWEKAAPDMPFLHSFLDDSFNEMYRAEQRIGKVAIIFAFLTILIACLGLFGLVTYMIEQRIKEIGIRKVLGASVASIVGILSLDFLKLVLISIFIGSPVAYFAMNYWLRDFASRIDIAWWVFVLAGFSAITIAILTVIFQATKAALSNPLESLKTE